MGNIDPPDQPLSFANYQLTAPLAEGRMGNVYKAKSHGVEGFEKILCVKIIDEELAEQSEFIETLIEEAKRAVSLSHANVAQVYDLGREEESESFYLAGEYVNGFDLGRALTAAREAGREWPRDLSLYIASETAKGIDYAHRRKDFNFNNLNLLHRDVHPSNILISFDGEVKVTDFGISRAMEVAPVDREPTPERRYRYAPPEHVRDQTYTRKSDIFSLGLVLYEMLTGSHPYVESERPVRDAARRADIPSLGEVVDVPRKLQQIVDSMLVPDPTGRTASAGEVYEGLVGYLFGNNLRADDRALSLLIEELRQAESEDPTTETESKDAGMEEISRSDLENFYDKSSASLQPPVDRIRQIREDRENADERKPPTDETAALDEPSGPLPDLPGGLEECFESALAGDGRAVLMSGHFGRGPDYLPDRVSEVLEWRANARALGVHATPDDVYRPFGVLGDAVVRFLTDGPFDDAEAQRRALEQLEKMGADAEGVELLRGLWGRSEPPQMSYERRIDRLSRLCVSMLRETSSDRPVVLVVDRVERTDALTLDVLREAIGAIDDVAAMLVLATSADELMRAAFDVGHPDSLRAIRVSAPHSGELGGIPDLSTEASEVLLSLALSEQPLSYEALGDILQCSVERITRAAEELTNADLVRTPDAETLLTGVAEASVWVKQRFDPAAIRRNARSLSRHFAGRTSEDAVHLWGPTRMRLHATAHQRRRTLHVANRYGDWLEQNGWLDIALDLYNHCSDLLAQETIGSPQTRIDFLLARAELALDLSRPDQARNSLEPLRALSETVRNETGFVRSQILFGRMALQRDNLEKARDCLKRATDVARGLREPQLLAVGLTELASWSDRFGDLVEAQKHLEGARNLAGRWGTYRMDRDHRSRLLLRAVRIYVQRQMERRALDAFDDLESLATSAGPGHIEARAGLAEAELHGRRGAYDAAITALEAARETSEHVGRTALTIAILRRHTALSLEAERLEESVELAGELVDLSARHDDPYSEQRGRDLRATASAVQTGTEGIEHLRASLERAKHRRIPRDLHRGHRYLALALEEAAPEEAAEHREAAREIGGTIRYASLAA